MKNDFNGKLMALAAGHNRVTGHVRMLLMAADETSRRLVALERTLEAVMDVVGKDQVLARISENLRAAEEAREAEMSKSLADALVAGTAKAAEKATMETIVVLQNAEGKKSTLLVQDLLEPIRLKVLDQPVGTKFEVEGQGAFELLGVYEDAEPVLAADAPPAESVASTEPVAAAEVVQ